MRAREAGYRVVCAEEAFVHHFGQASIGRIGGGSVGFGMLFHQNRKRWEEKWGRVWEPHRHRKTDRDRELAGRIREVVGACVPEGAVIAVVSHGDDELVEFEGRTGWHFPQTPEGSYAGYHPADDRAAIAHLEEVRGRGARFLLFPEPSLWWLSHYNELAQYLERHYTVVDTPSDECRVFSLGTRRRVPMVDTQG